MESMLVPEWLERLLSTTFFRICQQHTSAPRNECNMYCLDCKDHAFCFYCRSSWHKDHQVIQIRRSSYHDVVRVAEIHKVLDISGVQTYVINSARVIFLNERSQPKNSATAKTSSHICEICARSLLDPFRFCSLGCKLVGIKSSGSVNGNGNAASFVLSAKKDEETGMGRRLPSREDDEQELREGSHKQVYQNTPLHPSSRTPRQVCSNSRRRKGVPHRAPLGP